MRPIANFYSFEMISISRLTCLSTAEHETFETKQKNTNLKPGKGLWQQLSRRRLIFDESDGTCLVASLPEGRKKPCYVSLDSSDWLIAKRSYKKGSRHVTNETQIQAWHEEGLLTVGQFKRAEARLVELLSSMYRTQGFYNYKCACLKDYAVYVWEISEHAARDMVTVAIKAVDYPEMIEALYKKEATVSKLRKICPVISPEESKNWLALVRECSARIVEKTVAMAQPEATVDERVIYKCGNRLELTTGVSEELMSDLRYVQDLMSQNQCKAVSIEKMLEVLTDSYLERHDPVRKAERSRLLKEKRKQNRARKSERQCDELANEIMPERLTPPEGSLVGSNDEDSRNEIVAPESPTALSLEKSSPRRQLKEAFRNSRAARVAIPLAIKHAVHARDGFRCTEINPNGERCAHRRWLDIHHVVHVSEGGTDKLENLTTVCRGHHRATHFHEMKEETTVVT